MEKVFNIIQEAVANKQNTSTSLLHLTFDSQIYDFIAGVIVDSLFI